MLPELLRRLQALGVPAEIRDGDYVEVRVEQAVLTIERRPTYCDRGRLLVKVTPRSLLAFSFDSQDGFPRYYFGLEACATEVLAWLQARNLLPVSP